MDDHRFFVLLLSSIFFLKKKEKLTFRTFGQVAFHVEGEMIRTGETAFAHLAAERFGARVFPVVTRELVGTCEAPLTFGPMAAVRFLTCMNPLMGFQV